MDSACPSDGLVYAVEAVIVSRRPFDGDDADFAHRIIDPVGQKQSIKQEQLTLPSIGSYYRTIPSRTGKRASRVIADKAWRRRALPAESKEASASCE